MDAKEPSPEEIEAVGHALLAINEGEYDETQLDEINNFLKSYTADYAQNTMAKLFDEEYEVLEAVEKLYQFVENYQSNQEIMSELKMEMDEIFYNLNESSGSIYI